MKDKTRDSGGLLGFSLVTQTSFWRCLNKRSNKMSKTKTKNGIPLNHLNHMTLWNVFCHSQDASTPPERNSPHFCDRWGMRANKWSDHPQSKMFRLTLELRFSVIFTSCIPQPEKMCARYVSGAWVIWLLPLHGSAKPALLAMFCFRLNCSYYLFKWTNINLAGWSNICLEKWDLLQKSTFNHHPAKHPSSRCKN